jgi:hypothetical protein
VSQYNPISLPAVELLTLTPLPTVTNAAGAILPVLTATEKYGGLGYIFPDPVSGFDIGYGNQLNANNMYWIVQAMGVPAAQLAAATAACVQAMKGVTQITALQSALNNAIGAFLPGQPFFLSVDQAEQALLSIVQNITIPGLNTLCRRWRSIWMRG